MLKTHTSKKGICEFLLTHCPYKAGFPSRKFSNGFQIFSLDWSYFNASTNCKSFLLNLTSFEETKHRVHSCRWFGKDIQLFFLNGSVFRDFHVLLHKGLEWRELSWIRTNSYAQYWRSCPIRFIESFLLFFIETTWPVLILKKCYFIWILIQN